MKTFQFGSLNTSGQWLSVWKIIFDQLKSSDYNDSYTNHLSAIRILSRDKTNLNQINNEQFELLLNIGNIGSKNIKCSSELMIEALKCLCNLVYNSTKCQEMSANTVAAEGIVKRLRTYKYGKKITKNTCYIVLIIVRFFQRSQRSLFYTVF